MSEAPRRFSAVTVVGVAVIVGAAAFAAGRRLPGQASTAAMPSAASSPVAPLNMELPPPSSDTLPPGHPKVGDVAPSGPSGAVGPNSPMAPRELFWTVPERWQEVPSPSNMRLATYRVPRSAGDTDDCEVSVTQAGGAIDANVERWFGQFGEPSKRVAKRVERTVERLRVVVVEVEGTFEGGMGADAKVKENWALLGAIVDTKGMPHFFKMTGPARSVKAARSEFDKLVQSFRDH